MEININGVCGAIKRLILLQWWLVVCNLKPLFRLIFTIVAVYNLHNQRLYDFVPLI